jgi:hypothetical protein
MRPKAGAITYAHHRADGPKVTWRTVLQSCPVPLGPGFERTTRTKGRNGTDLYFRDDQRRQTSWLWLRLDHKRLSILERGRARPAASPLAHLFDASRFGDSCASVLPHASCSLRMRRGRRGAVQCRYGDCPPCGPIAESKKNPQSKGPPGDCRTSAYGGGFRRL